MIGSLLITLIGLAVDLYCLIIVLQVAIHWLGVFEVIKTDSEKAKSLIATLDKLTAPAYERVRKFSPKIGEVDTTPLVLILGLQLIMGIIAWVIISPRFWYY